VTFKYLRGGFMAMDSTRVRRIPCIRLHSRLFRATEEGTEVGREPGPLNAEPDDDNPCFLTSSRDVLPFVV